MSQNGLPRRLPRMAQRFIAQPFGRGKPDFLIASNSTSRHGSDRRLHRGDRETARRFPVPPATASPASASRQGSTHGSSPVSPPPRRGRVTTDLAARELKKTKFRPASMAAQFIPALFSLEQSHPRLKCIPMNRSSCRHGKLRTWVAAFSVSSAAGAAPAHATKSNDVRLSYNENASLNQTITARSRPSGACRRSFRRAAATIRLH